MNRNKSFGAGGRLEFLYSVLLTVCLVFPVLTEAQDLKPEVPQEVEDLKTSVGGALQQRLAAAYPDSFRQGVEIFWEPGELTPKVRRAFLMQSIS